MSKTLGSILTIAGAAALVASGVGAIGGLALFGTTAGISISAAGVSVGVGALLTASTVLVAAGSLISGLGNKAPRAETTSTAIKTERPPRFSAYGRGKMWATFEIHS